MKPSAEGVHSFPNGFLGEIAKAEPSPGSVHSQSSCSTGSTGQVRASSLGARKAQSETTALSVFTSRMQKVSQT